MNPLRHDGTEPVAATALPVSPAERPHPLKKRRWVPATALIGSVLGAGILLTATANADDGGSATPSAPSTSASPAAPAGPAAGGVAPDGSTVTPPAPPSDGSAPTPPADGSAPTPPAPPSDGSAPTPPADGTAPTPPAGPGQGPAGGPAAGPAADGSTVVVGVVAATGDGSLTVQADDGQSTTASFTDSTKFGPAGPPAEAGATPTQTSATDFTTGKRVEIRVLDGSIVDARLVEAHADGTLTALSGSSGTVTTREGLKVAVDLSQVSSTAAVGDQVHVRGTVDAAGTTITASSVEVPPTK